MMEKPIKLICSQDQFEDIHFVLDKARKNAKQVKVNRIALVNLLIDHAALIKKVEDLGSRVFNETTT